MDVGSIVHRKREGYMSIAGQPLFLIGTHIYGTVSGVNPAKSYVEVLWEILHGFRLVESIGVDFLEEIGKTVCGKVCDYPDERVCHACKFCKENPAKDAK